MEDSIEVFDSMINHEWSLDTIFKQKRYIRDKNTNRGYEEDFFGLQRWKRLQ